MGNLAIIPARGGSKRIPRKNIKDFLGKPIIAYSIETALKSGLFEEVMVSTDDEEIAHLAKEYGASVPFLRTQKNADDLASTLDVLKEVGYQYKNQGKSFEYVCCLYPTAPLAKCEQLAGGLELLVKDELDCVFPVVAFSYPIWRGLYLKNGFTQMVWPEYAKSRSQDLQEVYHDAGQWYWYNPEKIGTSLFTNRTASLVLSEMEVQDIDSLSDWHLAELKFKMCNEQ